MQGSRRETRLGHAIRSPVWNGLGNPAQAAEMDRAPATPRYDTGVGEKFRGGGGQDCVGGRPSGDNRGYIGRHVRFPLTSRALH